MTKRYFDPHKLKVGDLILDDYPLNEYYGMITFTDDIGYIVVWNNPHQEDYYPYDVVTGLEWKRVVQDKKKQLEIKIKCNIWTE
jgi:hypothetical protein